MKIIKYLLIFLLTISIFSECKKDKLTGSNEVLEGTWASISTLANCGIAPGQPINPNLKLAFLERGKYKLYYGDIECEQGQLVIKSGFVTFECFKKRSVLDGKTILNFNSDTLNINRNGCDDDYEFKFVRN